jgi:hypothetical protein
MRPADTDAVRREGGSSMILVKKDEKGGASSAPEMFRTRRGSTRRESGSITIEAIISLSFFVFVIITILSVINVCLIQARMAFAINSTAREISEYSYLYSLIRSGLSSGKEGVKTEDVSKETVNVFGAIQGIAGGEDIEIDFNDIGKVWDDIIKNGEVEESGGKLAEAAENMASDPVKFLFGLVRLASKGDLNLDISSRIAAPIVTAMIKKHLTDERGGQPESFLRSMRVLPRADSYMSGLNLRSSLLFPNGTDYIIVNVRYRVKMIPLLPLNIHFDFNQTAVTRGWMQGDRP